MQNQTNVTGGFDATACSLSREQVAAILVKLAEAEAIADAKDIKAERSEHREASRYYRGQGNGLFRAACLIREVMRGELLVCEHGVEDGEYCQPCNAEYKRAAACDGQD